MKFEVKADAGGHYTWRLYSGSQMVAWAGESFYSRSNAVRAAEAFKVGAATARYEVYLDAGSKYRWRAWRSSSKVASSGESFASRSNAQRAADNVRDNAGKATGP
ncbi:MULTISPECIES: hypothetical protein [unclassified Kribbella]|uniref:hypothetical protein n=1 Tax=unclassified Kribbella TaxID=2644121 RepID=UPI00307767C2